MVTMGTDFRDDEIAALLDSSDDELGAGLRDPRQTYTGHVAADVASRHLTTLMVEAWTLPVARTTPSWRRRGGVMVGVAVGVLALTAGAASADVLPEPVQDTIAALAKPLGIDLPDS